MSHAELVWSHVPEQGRAEIAQGALEAAEIESIVSRTTLAVCAPASGWAACGYWFVPRMLSERAGWSSQSSPLPICT